jgi:mono/diheme cytochrome c family protein
MEQPRPSAAQELYALHCAACHGASGDGNGRAARHLFPRPRDLRTGKTRLVSTQNGVPGLEDIESGLRRGMPGTAMRPFDDLSFEQRELLAQEVLRLSRDGLREELIDALNKEGEEIDPDEVREAVEFCTTPGQPARVPGFDSADSQAIARGKATYLELGCNNCHGEDGSGAADTPLFDEKGRPAPPRDLAYEPFKGGHEPESIYLRILLGMPGTPHPACSNVAEQQLIDVVYYCLSLSREPKRTLTNHERAIQATSIKNLAGALERIEESVTKKGSGAFFIAGGAQKNAPDPFFGPRAKKTARLSLAARPRDKTRSLRGVPPQEGTAHDLGNSFVSDKRACKLTGMTILDSGS